MKKFFCENCGTTVFSPEALKGSCPHCGFDKWIEEPHHPNEMKNCSCVDTAIKLTKEQKDEEWEKRIDDTIEDILDKYPDHVTEVARILRKELLPQKNRRKR